MSNVWNSIDWKGLKRSAVKARQSTASSMKNWVMTDIENLTREVTADTTWGASGTQLDEVARASYNRDDYPLIMGVLWQRLTSRRWRCVYKGLELLKHLLLHGTARVLDEARDARYHIQSLEAYRYIDSRTGKDEGQNVRTKAAELYQLIENPKTLEVEREKSRALKSKIGITPVTGPSSYSGMSSDTSAFAGQAYSYQYDEELDGPEEEKSLETAPVPAVPKEPIVEDLLDLSNEPFVGNDRKSTEPIVEFTEDSDPFAPKALPAPPLAPPVDSLDGLLGLGAPESSSFLALEQAPPPALLAKPQGGSSSLSSSIFAEIPSNSATTAAVPTAKNNADSNGFSGFSDTAFFDPFSAKSAPTQGYSGAGGSTKTEAKSSMTQKKSTLDAFDELVDFSQLSVNK